MNPQWRLPLALLSLRLSIFLVMGVWTLDKFLNPAHAGAVYAHFYFLPGLSAATLYALGAAEALLLLGFVSGFARTWTYGLVLMLHGVSTLSSYAQYLAPFAEGHLLFFAAWPMWAACFALFLLRDEDRLWTLSWPAPQRQDAP